MMPSAASPWFPAAPPLEVPVVLEDAAAGSGFGAGDITGAGDGAAPSLTAATSPAEPPS